jgi:DNA-binding NarL/FixJ family response regulator
MSLRIRVLVVEDHSILRAALVTAIRMSGELLLAGEASTAAQAFESCRVAWPDIVLLGLHLPDMTVPETTAQLCKEFAGIKIINIARYEAASEIHASVKAGARGFVLRDMLATELLPAIQAVATGRVYFPPEFGFVGPCGAEAAAAKG